MGLLAGPRALAAGLRDAAAAAPVLVGRVGTLLDEAAGLLGSASGLLQQIWILAEQVGGLLDEVTALLRRIEVVRVEAADVVHAAGTTAEGAAGVLRVIGPPAVRVQPVLSAAGEIDPELVRWLVGITQQLQPLLATVADLDDTIAADTSELVRRMPELLRSVDELIVPALNLMGEAVPEVKTMRMLVERLEPVMVDMETRLAGIPGASRLRRRGEKVIEGEPGLPHEKIAGQVTHDAP